MMRKRTGLLAVVVILASLVLSPLVQAADVKDLTITEFKRDTNQYRSQDITLNFLRSGPHFQGNNTTIVKVNTVIQPDPGIASQVITETLTINGTLQYVVTYTTFNPQCVVTLVQIGLLCQGQGFGNIFGTELAQRRNYNMEAKRCYPLGTCTVLQLDSYNIVVSNDPGNQLDRLTLLTPSTPNQTIVNKPMGNGASGGTIPGVYFFLRPDAQSNKTLLDVRADLANLDKLTDNVTNAYLMSYRVNSTSPVSVTVNHQFGTDYDATLARTSCLERGFDLSNIGRSVDKSIGGYDACLTNLAANGPTSDVDKFISGLFSMAGNLIVFIFGVVGGAGLRDIIQGFLTGVMFYVFAIAGLFFANIPGWIFFGILFTWLLGIMSQIGHGFDVAASLERPAGFVMLLVGVVSGMVEFMSQMVTAGIYMASAISYLIGSGIDLASKIIGGLVSFIPGIGRAVR